jgi:hypothetical protein
MAPRNAYPACLLAKNDRISVECLNLVHQVGVIPLGMAPRNAYPVKCLFLFLSRSMRSALCAMLVTPPGLHAPYALRHALCAMRSALCHQSSAICHLLSATCLPFHRGSGHS